MTASATFSARVERHFCSALHLFLSVAESVIVVLYSVEPSFILRQVMSAVRVTVAPF